MKNLSKDDYNPFDIEFGIDSDTMSNNSFIIAYLNYLPGLGMEKTQSYLDKIEPIIESILQKIEEELKSKYNTERSTEKYWEQEYCIYYK
jgi:hypothetical protein